MTFRALFCLLLAGLIFAGCATKEKPAEGTPSPSPTPVQAAPAETVGKKSGLWWLGYFSPRYLMGKIFPKKPKPPQAEAPRLIGTIKMVNKEDRFVLIDAVSVSGIQPGDALVCIVNQRESAFLRSSPLKNPPFLIADITGGSPSPGDKVFKQ
jgi:hypothetical protein